MSALPIWAKKPKHKKEVIPTNRGWVVKETDELLSSYRGLLDKLEALNVEISDFQADVVVPEKEDDVVTTDELPELTTTESASGDQEDGEPEAELEQGKEEKSEDEKTEKVVEVKKEEQTKKRRGRPPANKKNA